MFKAITFLVLFIFTQCTYADEITIEKKLVIDEMLEITGALKVGEMIGTAIVSQMIAAMSQQQMDLDPKFIEIIQDEVGKVMHEEFIANGFVHEMSYTIYHKYFTLVELKEMVAFYKTPTGRKMALVLPQVAQEGLLAGQQHGQSLGPIIQQRLLARFEKEQAKEDEAQKEPNAEPKGDGGI